MAKYTNSFTSIALAKSGKCYSPAVVLVKEGDASKLLIGKSSAIGAEMPIYGDTLETLSFTKPVPSYQAVDLGLEVKWCNMNVEAYSPSEFGKYFAWGDTTGATADEVSGKFSDSWYSGTGLTAITTNLTLEQDAAHVNMGGDWRMPTSAEMEALTGLTNEWTTENGVNGRKFHGSGAKSANSIFVPAAGYCGGNGRFYVGTYGYYWTSSLYGSSGACYLGFGSGYVDVGNSNRCCGQGVRAVCA